MHIRRSISIGHLDDKVKQSDYTKHLTGEERVSLLEELRYDLGKFLKYDYSRRFERSLSVVEREQNDDLLTTKKAASRPQDLRDIEELEG